MPTAERPDGRPEPAQKNSAAAAGNHPDAPSALPPTAVNPLRRQLRQGQLAYREGLSAAQAAAFSAALCGHLQSLLQKRYTRLAGHCLAFCWPIRNEPDIRPLITAALAAGASACLPVVQGEQQALAFRRWTPATPLVDDRYGIPTPSSGDWLTPDILLLPCNAVDDAGYRLGYGGGFFDRTLPTLPEAFVVGLVHDHGRVATIHPQPHDRPLAALVSESGAWLRVNEKWAPV